jgi:hypothetical protein
MALSRFTSRLPKPRLPKKIKLGRKGASSSFSPEDEKDFFLDAEDPSEELPGVSNGAAFDAPELDAESAPDADEDDNDADDSAPGESDSPYAGTKLHNIVWRYWGSPEVADQVCERFAPIADLNSAKKTRSGFKIKLVNGHTVQWGIVKPKNRPGQQPQAPYEAIKAKKIGFTLDDAFAIVLLAQAHGWSSINVHGSKKHKDMLWLATQIVAYQQMQEAAQANGGKLPDGFRPITVGNHTPSEEVHKQWRDMLEAEQNAGAPEAYMPLEDDEPAVTKTPAEDEAPAEPKAAKPEDEAEKPVAEEPKEEEKPKAAADEKPAEEAAAEETAEEAPAEAAKPKKTRADASRQLDEIKARKGSEQPKEAADADAAKEPAAPAAAEAETPPPAAEEKPQPPAERKPPPGPNKDFAANVSGAFSEAAKPAAKPKSGSKAPKARSSAPVKTRNTQPKPPRR